ncbi:MAG TPA: pilus assembly protein TadG-related protein [Sphingomicrobium sp.]|jgi:Flp pilus assembly protein TadG|nr:pilus assembly protein TadG-related protein [Sphingomicrobium sp.]
MIGFLKKLKRNQRGNVLIITAAAMPLLVGSAGLATDTIQWALWKRDLQRAADSAAIAGVYERIQTDSTDNVEDAVTNDLDTTGNIGLDLLNDPEIEFPADDAADDLVDQVRVTLQVQKPLTFSSMFITAPIITATGTAASIPGTDDYCVMALETNAARTGVTIGGNAKIEMDCGIISNSPSANDCLINNGNASTVTATVMACVGGLRFSRNWTVPKYDPYTEAVEDPYGDIEVDRAAMRCFEPSAGRKPLLGTSTSNNFNGANATTTLAYAKTVNPSVNCFRGLSVGSGQTMNLPDGTYYIGEAGADIQGTLTCASCTIVLTRTTTTAAVGTLRVNSNGLLGIHAPTDDSNPYKGIAVFQDRNAIDNTNANRINGNSATFVQGAIYFPKQEITFNGGGTETAVCTRLVARRLVVSGNAGQAYAQKLAAEADCDMFDDDPIGGGRRVRLVA